MTNITYHVKVNETAGTAAVSTTPPDATFNAGDQVSFEGTKGTVIHFPNGTPFKEKIEGHLSLPAGPYTLKSSKVPYHFECGHIVNKVFQAWKGGAGIPPDL